MQKVIATQNEIIEDEGDFFGQIEAIQKARAAAVAAGVPALRRLVALCESSDSGQVGSVARVLAGLYNGHAYPLPLFELRGLDLSIVDDCMAAIRLDAVATEQEVHCYFDQGGARFQAIFKKFGIHAAPSL